MGNQCNQLLDVAQIFMMSGLQLGLAVALVSGLAYSLVRGAWDVFVNPYYLRWLRRMRRLRPRLRNRGPATRT